MIARVQDKGARVGGLIRYLYGPGKREEHVNPRIVAAWDGAPKTDVLEPAGRDRGFDCRRLISALEEPIAFGVRPPDKPVWHTSIRAAPEDRILSDEQWGHIAREFMNATGLAKYNDVGAVRWVAIRHNDDHIHIAATLVRQDGKRASTWNDWYSARAMARDIEERYGLRRTGPADRTAVRRPHPVELNKTSLRAGSHDTARDQLRRIVRQSAALAADEHDFFTRLDAQRTGCSATRVGAISGADHRLQRWSADEPRRGWAAGDVLRWPARRGSDPSEAACAVGWPG